MKKTALTLIVSMLSLQAHASVTMFCEGGDKTLEGCATRVERALERLGCQVDPSQTVCEYALRADPKIPDATIPTDSPYCRVATGNCFEPAVGNFGGESCGQATKTRVSRAERVHNGYWFGIFGSYSRTVCIRC